MGNNELANALGVSKALVSKLVGRGMPTSSASAAQAWRQVNAPPRQWKATTSPSPIMPRQKSAEPSQSASPTAAPSPTASAAPATAPATATEAADTPSESLRRARSTERQSFKKLEAMQRDKTASPEDLRKSSSVYFAARNNRAKAEADHRDHLRAEGVTLFLEEAQDITNRGHLAVANKLREGPKALSPRLHGMSQKSIEQTLADFFDGIADHLRQSF